MEHKSEDRNDFINGETSCHEDNHSDKIIDINETKKRKSKGKALIIFAWLLLFLQLLAFLVTIVSEHRRDSVIESLLSQFSSNALAGTIGYLFGNNLFGIFAFLLGVIAWIVSKKSRGQLTIVISILLISANVYLAFRLCNNDTSIINVQDNNNRILHRDDILGYEITYHKSWEINPLAPNAVFALKNSDDEKLGVLSVNVANLKMDSDQLRKFIRQDKGKQYIEQIRTRFPNAILIDTSETYLGSFPAFQTICSYTNKNLDYEMTIIAHQIVCIRNHKIWLINFESPKFSYEENLCIAKEFLKTFNFR